MTSLRDLEILAHVSPAEDLRSDSRITERLSGQERCLWCWAAVAQFTLRWANIDREQCDIATQHLGCDPGEGEPQCCDDQSACIQIESLRRVLKRQGCLVERLRVPAQAPSSRLERLRQKVLEKLEGADPEPVAFRVQYSNYKHFIVCNGLAGEMVLIEDPCGPHYTFEPEASFLRRMLYNGEFDITHIYFLRKSDGSFKC